MTPEPAAAAVASDRLVIVAPDKFKGSMSARDVASIVAEGFEQVDPTRRVRVMPIADGGEGTIDLAIRAGGGPVSVEVQGPLGDPVLATYVVDGSEAVVELAQAAGLHLVEVPSSASAGAASTFGVGEIIAHAIDRGAERVVVGLGGSATTDGGAGLAVALGARLMDEAGEPVRPGVVGLGRVAAVDFGPMIERLRGVDVVLATDVDIPLLGSNGAAAVFGPQKGAAPEDVEQFDQHLERWIDLVETASGVSVRADAGAGAAGGAGSVLMSAVGARVVSGVGHFLGLFDFEAELEQAGLVVVGEGSLDSQSLRGKGPIGVARLARSKGARVVAVVGRNLLTEDELRRSAIDEVYALSDIEPDAAICISDAERILRGVALRLADAETRGVN